MLAVCCCANAQATPRVLQPQDLFQMQWVSDPQINKTGTATAYVRLTYDIMTDNQVKSVWLVDTATGAQTPLATGPGSYSSPRWSPDGSKIAYLAKGADGHMQIMVHWLHGETAQLTRLLETPSDLTWSADGKRIAFIMLEPVAGPKIGKPLEKPPGAQWADGPVVVAALNYRADGAGFDKPGFHHLYVISLDGADNPRALTSGPFSDAGPLAWSPSGQWIYFASNHDSDWNREPEDGARHTAVMSSIYRISTITGELTQLSHEIGPYNAPVVSPDGKSIAFLGYQDKYLGNQNVRLNVMDADGRQPRVLGESLDLSLLNYHWAADGKSFYVSYVEKGVTKVARLRLDGHLEPMATGLAAATAISGGEFTVSDQGWVAYTGGSTKDLPQLYLAQEGRNERLTNLNSGLFSSVTLGELSALPVKSSVDGREIGAWEVVPPNFDPARKYPLILNIHGGPYDSYGPTFAWEQQFYAAAGYIVVFGNPRGSSSYGEAFANLIDKNYPSQDYDDLMSMVDAAIQRGGVDADNLFVTGTSGGGVLTAWIVGKTHRFKAAVTQRPVIDWASWLLTTDMSAFGARYWFKRMPWEDPETYWRHSPLSLVGNVTTPTLVIVGASDLRTPTTQGEQFYQALQLRHVPTELYEEPGAAHGGIRPSQLAQQYAAILEWFERYRSSPSH